MPNFLQTWRDMNEMGHTKVDFEQKKFKKGSYNCVGKEYGTLFRQI